MVPRFRLRLLKKGRPSSDLARSTTWPSTTTSVQVAGAPPGILAVAGRSGRNPVITTLALLLPNTAAPIAKLLPSGQMQAPGTDAFFLDCGAAGRDAI